MSERLKEKLTILADAAKYDVSCASSGSKRSNSTKGIGDSSGMGICHTYTEDGRCVSLLKILLTNHCIFDCAYCVSRKSNDIKRAAFTVDEVVSLTINFYRRNYIEGLFLSSGIFHNPDYTMERLVRIAKKLRAEQNFNGYIHLKTIPGASDELVREAGRYADRLSVNLELPSEKSLKMLAPEKNYKAILQPMNFLKKEIEAKTEEKKILKHAPKFASAGQSTQLIIGATPEDDRNILTVATHFYQKYRMRRVYYSASVPVLKDHRLPSPGTLVPTMRENRLYQADWLLRFYGFNVNELFTDTIADLDHEVDPKTAWALRNLHLFPIDINSASREMLLRIPGVGQKSVAKIIAARRYQLISFDHLHQFGIATNRARHFLFCKGNMPLKTYDATALRLMLLSGTSSKYAKTFSPQLSLFTI